MLQARNQATKSGSSLKIRRNQLVALGSNVTSPAGNPGQTLQNALQILQNCGAMIRATSAFYHTPAFPAGIGPDFVNACVMISTEWRPDETLAQLHAIEAELGRLRKKRWGERTLDLDLLAAGDAVLPDAQTQENWRNLALSEQVEHVPDDLILPHPRLQDRAFVLAPLCDIAPDWRHPLLGLTARQMLDALPETEKTAVRRV